MRLERKMRCDGNRPTCGNCLGKGDPCVYTDFIRRRGPGKNPKKGKTGSGRKQVQQQQPRGAGSSTSAGTNLVNQSETRDRTPLMPAPAPLPMGTTITSSVATGMGSGVGVGVIGERTIGSVGPGSLEMGLMSGEGGGGLSGNGGVQMRIQTEVIIDQTPQQHHQQQQEQEQRQQQHDLPPRRDFNFPHQHEHEPFGRVGAFQSGPSETHSLDPVPFSHTQQQLRYDEHHHHHHHHQSASYQRLGHGRTESGQTIPSSGGIVSAYDPALSSTTTSEIGPSSRQVGEQKKRKRTIGAGSGVETSGSGGTSLGGVITIGSGVVASGSGGSVGAAGGTGGGGVVVAANESEVGDGGGGGGGSTVTAVAGASTPSASLSPTVTAAGVSTTGAGTRASTAYAVQPLTTSSTSASASAAASGSSSTTTAGDPIGAIKRAKTRREASEASTLSVSESPSSSTHGLTETSGSTSTSTSTSAYPIARGSSARYAEEVRDSLSGDGHAGASSSSAGGSLRLQVPRTESESGPRERRPSSIEKGKRRE